MSYQDSFICKSIFKNGLQSVEPILKKKKKNILEFTEPAAIYNCLSWFSDEELRADYIFINNPQLKSHIILMNYRVSLVFVGYGEDGWYVTINPLDCVMGRRNNHQLLSYRYMLFARYQTLEEDMYLNPVN